MNTKNDKAGSTPAHHILLNFIKYGDIIMNDEQISTVEWHRGQLIDLLKGENTGEIESEINIILEKAKSKQRVLVHRGGKTFWREQEVGSDQILELVRSVKDSMDVNLKSQTKAEEILSQGEGVIERAKIATELRPVRRGIIARIRSKKAVNTENAKYALPEVAAAMVDIGKIHAEAMSARAKMNNKLTVDMYNTLISKEGKIARLMAAKKHLDITTERLDRAIITGKVTIDAATMIGTVMESIQDL